MLVFPVVNYIKRSFMDYQVIIRGVVVSVQKVEKKTYGEKVSDAKSIISFVRVLEDGKLETLKIKAPYEFDIKKGSKVELPVSVSAMSNGSQATIFYSLIS